MIDKMSRMFIQETSKTVAKTVLSTTSLVLDKGAELADEANQWLENLDKKDTTKREDRKTRRDT